MRSTVAHWLFLLVPMLAVACIKEVERKVPYKADAVTGEAVEADATADLPADRDSLVEIHDLRGDPDDLLDATKDEAAPPEMVEQAEHEVGPDGGTFLFTGGVLLVVPPGALSKKVTIGVSVSSQELPDDAVAVTGVFDLAPAGTKFSKSVVVRLPLVSPEDVEADKWALVKGFVGGDGQFETVPAWPDLASGLAWVQLSHFSAVFAGYGQQGSTCLSFELCNGKDDDCDGQTDDEPSFSELSGCKTAGPVCTGLAKIVCEEGKWKCDYSATNPEFFEEEETLCDAVDNDCDGLTDEGIAGDVKDLPEALCKSKGVCKDAAVKAACTAGKWMCDYSKVASYQGSAELTCDGKDNDCDGGVDEGVCNSGEPCPDDGACKQGHCVLPLGGADVSFCTLESEACLAVGDEAELVEVGDGSSWCGPEGKTVLDCAKGAWSKPIPCSLLFPLNPKCDPVLHECVGGCNKDEECGDDGDLCNGVEVCVDGGCKVDKSTIVFCPEGNTCADNLCQPETGKCVLQAKNEGAACDDGQKCTGSGKCEKGLCQEGTKISCVDSDDDPCTFDFCDPATGSCAHDAAPNVGKACDDANQCTAGDVCSADGACEGNGKLCSDGNSCTDDGCDPATGGCIYPPKPGGPCEDSDPCTGTGQCNAEGKCIAPPVDCSDFNDCTQDACDAAGACVHAPVTEGQNCIFPSSEPGAQDICTPFGKCGVAGNCKAGADLCGCHVDSDCTAKDKDLCDGLLTCQFAGQVFDCLPLPDSAVTCGTGQDTACTKNKCNPATGACALTSLPNGTPCQDGSACTFGDSCQDGLCVAGPALDCEDDNDCTVDSCEPATGCKYAKAKAGSPCNDGEPCSIADKCDNSGNCIPGAPKTPPCSDGDICTEDTCTEDGSLCLFPPILGCCKSAGDCSPGKVCYEQSCCSPVCEDAVLGKYECGDDGCGTPWGVCSGAAVCSKRKCCSPNCISPLKVCGDDGCGGSCGTCAAGKVCTKNFTCCTPNCAGRVCGGDGCGGTCGTCAPGTICSEATGICQPCTPVCGGKECGPDGCGAVCGQCPAGHPCLANGTCCTPQCAGLECGDDGCGGTCGTCAAWEECSKGLCECGKCCLNDVDCGAFEDCSGTIPGSQEKICKEKLRLFFEGFEGQNPGQPSPTFKYFFDQTNPWAVKDAAGDPFLANTGTRSHRYYRVKTDDGSYFYRSVWIPSVPEGGKSMLSFFARCTNKQVQWTLDVSVGGKVVVTVTQATCDGFWHRFVADVTSQPSGKADIKFRMKKTVQFGAELLIDDVALLVSACPEPIECASWSGQTGECKLASVAPDKCFIDLICYDSGAVHPEISCALCKPGSNSQDWTPDDSLCSDGNPATKDICDIKTIKGCYSF